jgi:hypothetical protein
VSVEATTDKLKTKTPTPNSLSTDPASVEATTDKLKTKTPTPNSLSTDPVSVEATTDQLPPSQGKNRSPPTPRRWKQRLTS